VCEKQLFGLVHKVHNVSVNEDQIEQYIPRIMDEFKDLSKEDIIKRFASLEFNRFLDYYRNAPDLNAPVYEERSSDRSRGDRYDRTSSRGNYTRLFINLGSVDDFTRGDMLGFICSNARISGKAVGKIDLKGVYTFFEVENAVVDQVQQGFKSVDFQGRNVRIELAGDRGESRGGGRERSSGGSFRERRERRSNSTGGFRDFSGKRRDERHEGNRGGDRRKKW